MRLTYLFAILTLAASTAGAQAPPEHWLDVHSHLQYTPGQPLQDGRKGALATMERHRILHSLVMPPPLATQTQRNFYDIEDLQFLLRDHPGRFSLLGGSSLNALIHGTRPEAVDDRARHVFRQRALAIHAQGAVGFGEIAVTHVSIPAMGAHHAFEDVPGDHPLLLLLADIAAETGLPVDLHNDLVPHDMPLPDTLRANPLNPPTLAANLAGFKRLLAHNPKAHFIWSHVGFEPLLTRQPPLVRQLLQEHPNLHMSFRLNRGAPRPGAALDPEGRVKPAWVQLVSDFPDRFMLGSDTFYSADGIVRGSSDEGLQNLRRLLDQLPPAVAAQVASGNAIRIYGLKVPAPK